MKALEIIFGMLVAIGVMFVFPVRWAEEKQKENEFYIIEQTVDDFGKRLCSDGRMTGEEYIALNNILSSVGGYYTTEIEWYKTVFEPVYETGMFTGEIFEYDAVMYNGEIMNEIENNGFIYFGAGDRIVLSAYDGNECFCSYSGIVNGRKDDE